ncbi:MAG TPA: hypothetical protein VNL74_05315 [Methylococcus sp.]|nr:hypothetical protein [Methylococcus sp.]
MTARQIEMARDLRARGWILADIAEAIGWTKSLHTLRRHLPELPRAKQPSLGSPGPVFRRKVGNWA